MKFFQRKTSKHYLRLGWLLKTGLTLGIVICCVILPFGKCSTISVEHTESEQQSESGTENKASEVKVNKASEIKVDKFSEIEVDESSEIEVDESSEPEIDESSEIEVDESSESEIDESSEIEVDESSEPEVNEPSDPETDGDSEIVTSYVIKGVKGIYQFPELPTGCEVTALTCLVNFWRINVDKVDLAMNYMPRSELRYETDGIFGPNPMDTFVGDPTTEWGSFGCFAPCLVRTFENYVHTNWLAEKYVAIDISGQSFESILQEYVANDCPVLVIVSPFLIEPKESITWNLEDGGTWTWQQGHHAMVVYGFDLESNEIYVADSAVVTGMATYALTDLEEIYIEKGMSAMTILPK